MSQMSNQDILIREALENNGVITYEESLAVEFTVYDIACASDNEFTWHVSFDRRLFSVVNSKTSNLRFERVR